RGGGGSSQGANAQRKRAARDDRDGTQGAARPRRDRSGRPEQKPAREGAGGGSSRGGTGRGGAGARSGAPRTNTTRSGSTPMYSSSTGAASGNPRQANRRVTRPSD